ncbi:MAG: CBS domain-containing protein [Sphingomonadaceae bacterium]
MHISHIIANRDASAIISCNPGMSVREAVVQLSEKRIGAIPVVENGAVIGIFSERDVVYRLATEGALCLDRSVGEVMTAPVVAVEPSTPIIKALALMTKRRIRHLPVEENGQMSGFVSIGDLVKFRIDQVEMEAEAMREYIQTA